MNMNESNNHMTILIINSEPSGVEFVEPIIKILTDTGIKFEVIEYTNIPKNLDSYAGIIISGSPMGDDIVYKHLPYYQWIRDSFKPILGICHGHQLIGAIYGADLIRNKQSEEGEHVINIEEPDPFFSGYEGSVKVKQQHKNSISLPDEFKLLASSIRCRVQAMVHQLKPIYTVQFHAENNPEMILNFIEIVRQAVTE
jgi:GMP synthase (glutamine-hydrolysing)